MIVATWQVGQLLWSMLWFFLFFMLIWVVVSVFADIFRSRDLGGWGKALWTLFVIVLPWLGVFVYLLARGRGMAERRMEARYGYPAPYAADPALGYVPAAPAPAAAPASGLANDLTTLVDLRDRGIIDETEFQAMKQKVVTP